MSHQLSQMQLPVEKKLAAEAALRKIRCSRPDWTSIRGYTTSGFNLSCN